MNVRSINTIVKTIQGDMARSEQLNKAMREASRRRILKAALRLFAAHGYADASIRMIAESAGTSVGLLYNYFPSKADLLSALFEESMRDVQASFASAEAGKTPSERIERLVRSAFEILDTNRDFWRTSYGVRMQPAVVAGLGKRLRTWTMTIQVTLARYLADAGSRQPEIDAALLFALIDGASQHYVLDPKGYPLAQVADGIIALFTRRTASQRL
jgi:AcrR family transcriptional regulator